MKYSERSQDIHKNDREIWQEFKNSWDRFQYSNALNQLQNAQFDTRRRKRKVLQSSLPLQ